MSSNDGTFSQRKYYVANYLPVLESVSRKNICTMYLQYCANHLESLQHSIVSCTSCFKLKIILSYVSTHRRRVLLDLVLKLYYRFHFFFRCRLWYWKGTNIGFLFYLTSKREKSYVSAKKY